MSSRLFQFGEEIDGYPVRVLNERAVRAAAGLLLLGNFQPTRWFVLIFLLDMGVQGAAQRGVVTGESPTVEADAQRCQVPAFAKALGHEQMWKQHHHCP
ncbi:MAG TPA: hypothetical protein VFY35_02905 [Burkholderiaceae bacterium]|nr:hypothetical protein [Burkholderiaceae bacterium]